MVINTTHPRVTTYILQLYRMFFALHTTHPWPRECTHTHIKIALPPRTQSKGELVIETPTQHTLLHNHIHSIYYSLPRTYLFHLATHTYIQDRSLPRTGLKTNGDRNNLSNTLHMHTRGTLSPSHTTQGPTVIATTYPTHCIHTQRIALSPSHTTHIQW